MWKIALALFVATPILASGPSLASQMELVQAYIEAEEYQEARAILQQVEEEEVLTAKQYATLKLNVVLLAIEEGDFEAAWDRLESIALPDDEGLAQRSFKLYALTAVSFAEEALEGESLEALKKGQAYVYRAQGVAPSILDADCEAFLLELRRIHVALQERYTEVWLEQSSNEEILDLLLKEVQQKLTLLQEWGELEEIAVLPSSVVKGRVAALAKRGIVDEVLWDYIRDKIQNESGAEEGWFSQGYDELYVSQDWLREEKLWKAWNALSTVALYLEITGNISAEKDPVLSVLENRVASLKEKEELQQDDPYAKSLLYQDTKRVYAANQLIQGIQHLVEQQEEKDPVVLPLLEAVSERLQLASIGLYKESLTTLFLYEQLSLSFEETMLAALDNLIEDQPLSEKELARLRAAEKRLELLLRTEAPPPYTAQVLQQLRKAFVPGQQGKDLHEILERALFFWNPIAYLQEELEQLLTHYNPDIWPITEGALSSLIDQGEMVVLDTEEVEKLLEGRGDRSLSEEEAGVVVEFVTNSLNALLQVRPQEEEGRYYFLQARQYVHRAHHMLSLAIGKTEFSCASILEWAIAEQAYMLDLDSVAVASDITLAGEQRFVLDAIAPFEEVMAAERQQAAEVPWDDVARYVIEGETVAQELWEELQKDPHAAARLQGDGAKVLELWEEALKLLQPPGEEEGEDNSEEGGAEAEAQAQLPQFLEEYQRMEQEDQQPKQDGSMVKRGLRPW